MFKRSSIWLLLIVVGFSTLAIAGEKEDQLFNAARDGDLATVKRLIEEEGVDVNSKTRYGATALGYAADKGHADIVSYLISKEADVNVVDTFYSATPLIWASMNENTEIVGMLIEGGATGSSNMLPRAVQQKDAEMLAALLKAKDLDPASVVAALGQAKQMEDNDEIVKMLEALDIKVEEKAAVEVDAETLAGYVGSYKSEQIGMTIAVRVEEGTLIGQAQGQPPISLRPVGDAEFESVEVPGINISFGGRDGLTEFLVLNQGGQTFQFARQAEAGTETAEAEAPAEEEEATIAPLAEAKRTAARNWPSFRGINADGNGDGQGAPTEWSVSDGKNVLWKTPVAGLANSSPIVWKDHVFITTAISAANDDTFRPGLYGDVDSVEDLSEHTFKVIALNLKSGEIAWEKTVSSEVPGAKRHLKSTQANSTSATDGKRVVSLFGTIGLLVAHDMKGKELWRKDIGVLDAGWFYDETYQWGHASSPILYNDMVIVQADIYKDSFIAAYSAKDGKLKWKTERESVPSWGTPTVYQGKNGAELVTNGQTVRGYDPATGKQLWTLSPNSEVTVATPIIANDLIYVTGGYPPARPVYALKPGGSGDQTAGEGETNIAWSKERGGTYMPTPVAYNGRLFTCNNDGRMVVYDAVSGEQIYRARVGGGGGTFTGSPIAADGKLYFSTEEGDVFVIRADTDEYVELAHNEMDEIIMSSPAVSDGVLIVRTMKHVYGLGSAE